MLLWRADAARASRRAPRPAWSDVIRRRSSRSVRRSGSRITSVLVSLTTELRPTCDRHARGRRFWIKAGQPKLPLWPVKATRKRRQPAPALSPKSAVELREPRAASARRVSASVRASVAIWFSWVLELFIVSDRAADPGCLVGGTTQQGNTADLVGTDATSRSVSREESDVREMLPDRRPSVAPTSWRKKVSARRVRLGSEHPRPEHRAPRESGGHSVGSARSRSGQDSGILLRAACRC